MYSRSDPRFRRRLNQITQNLESANESAQVGLFSFSEHYIKPCFGAVARSFDPCTQRCCPGRAERERKRRSLARSRGRPEYSFDFYDDWAEDESDALLSLENDEFDRVMGAGTEENPTVQPGKQKSMAYGAGEDSRYSRPRRKSSGDEIVIPNQSRFGFLSKLPFRSGGKGLRYKPSAADLQERPHVKANTERDGHGMYHDDDGERGLPRSRSGRVRSATTGSGHTTDSLSSRGDIFPSDDEDDAIPLDDEFAVALERRTTFDESSSGRTGASSRGTRPDGATRSSTRSKSERSLRRPRKDSRKASGSRSKPGSRGSEEVKEEESAAGQSLEDLKAEEQQAQEDEEEEIGRKREFAMRLAKEKGLHVEDDTQKSTPSIPPPSSPLSSVPPPGMRPDAEAAKGFPFPTIELQNTPRGSVDTSTRTSEELERPTDAGADTGSTAARDET